MKFHKHSVELTFTQTEAGLIVDNDNVLVWSEPELSLNQFSLLELCVHGVQNWFLQQSKP